MKRITVLLAEDHTIVREGFRKLLEHEADIEVIAEAQDGRQAVALVKKLRPAVVLMDIAMPLLNGLEATRQILKAVPATKVRASDPAPPTDDTVVPTPERSRGARLRGMPAWCREVREPEERVRVRDEEPSR